MTVQDVRALRDTTTDPEVKAAIRWSLNRIEELEAKLREVAVLVNAIQRVTKE